MAAASAYSPRSEAEGEWRCASRTARWCGCTGIIPRFAQDYSLGSTSLATDGAGEALSRQLYYPFGEVRWSSETPLPTDFGYTGQRLDGTGLMFYHARYYAPSLGRFIQADPLAEGKNPQTWNAYAYCLNNPINYIDLDGLLTDQQIKDFTGLDIDDVDKEVYRLLRALHFGDDLWSFGDVDDTWTRLGYAELDESGHLRFVLPSLNSRSYTVSDLNDLTEGGIGFALIRSARLSDGSSAELGLAYSSVDIYGCPQSPEIMLEAAYRVTGADEFFGFSLGVLALEEVGGILLGETLAYAAGGTPAGPAGWAFGGLVGFCMGILTIALISPPPGHQEGDRILEYRYEHWSETTIIRGDQMIGPVWEYKP